MSISVVGSGLRVGCFFYLSMYLEIKLSRFVGFANKAESPLSTCVVTQNTCAQTFSYS